MFRTPESSKSQGRVFGDTLFAPHPIQSVQSFFRKVPPPVLQREFQSAQSIGAVSNTKFLVFWEVLGGFWSLFGQEKHQRTLRFRCVFLTTQFFVGGSESSTVLSLSPKSWGKKWSLKFGFLGQ